MECLASPSTSGKTRKRTAHPENWKLNIAKRQRQTAEQKAINSVIYELPTDVPTQATVGAQADEIVLEELEYVEPQVKQRRQQKLIIDKKTELSTEYMRVRNDNIPGLEQKVENLERSQRQASIEIRNISLHKKESKQDLVQLVKKVGETMNDSSKVVANIRVPAHTYLSRPAHAGIRPNMAQVLSRLFLRNLRVLNRTPMADRELEEAVSEPRTRKTRTRNQLETIGEKVQQLHAPSQFEVHMQMEENVTNELKVEQLDLDRTEFPTWVVETLSQHASKQADEFQVPVSNIIYIY
ncbi:unnamed protein product [Parnassius apollo]|uniref:(apollo) hypothetical protein n=1 Tax=Parnassius apollo TaxID=110799 RepID=A0A8S3X7U3_PARAO|nr:unnamed protein product [Parnassius apollo]